MADSAMDVTQAGLVRWVSDRSEAFRASVETLWEIAFHHETDRDEVTTGHVITHVARVADETADVLHLWRTGLPAEIDRERRWPEYPGCDRPGGVIIDDIATALERLEQEAVESLGVAEPNESIRNLLLSTLVELIVHDLDLAVSPPCRDTELLGTLLDYEVARRQASAPGVQFRSTPDPAITIGGVTVVGQASDLLAWLTGRSSLGVSPGVASGTLPPLPEWRCYREFATTF
jgi:hypothetical protein